MASYAHLLKPERFSGEKNTIGVTDFLNSLEVAFTCLESMQDTTQKEQAKVVILQGHLDGKAKQFWLSLRSDKKATFELASQALKRRFPTYEDSLGDWEEKVKAVSEMNMLMQGSLTSAQYVEKANDLFNVLGEEYSLVLATKFVDGIIDDNTKLTVDAQLDEAYNFPDVIKAYEKCTKFLRRREMMKQRPEPIKDSSKTEQEMMVEAMKQNSQMVFQIGEVLKGLTLPKQQAERNFGGRGYQPIVGTVGSTQGGQNSSEYQKPRPNYGNRAQDRPYQPREDVVCFTCESPGHRAYECRFRNPPLREEQDK